MPFCQVPTFQGPKSGPSHFDDVEGLIRMQEDLVEMASRGAMELEWL